MFVKHVTMRNKNIRSDRIASKQNNPVLVNIAISYPPDNTSYRFV